MEADSGIRVGRGIVEVLQRGLVGEFGGHSLVGSKGAKGNKHGGINGLGIVEENANYLLESGDTGLVEKGRGVNGCS
jgi:hypothetical protein